MGMRDVIKQMGVRLVEFIREALSPRSRNNVNFNNCNLNSCILKIDSNAGTAKDSITSEIKSVNRYAANKQSCIYRAPKRSYGIIKPSTIYKALVGYLIMFVCYFVVGVWFPNVSMNWAFVFMIALVAYVLYVEHIYSTDTQCLLTTDSELCLNGNWFNVDDIEIKRWDGDNKRWYNVRNRFTLTLIGSKKEDIIFKSNGDAQAFSDFLRKKIG